VHSLILTRSLPSLPIVCRYDHDIRIPMVIMGPGIEANISFDFIGSNADVAPTFLALAGVDPTTVLPRMDGKSIASQLIKTSTIDTPRVLNKNVPTDTAVIVEKEMAAGAPWRDHHW
jgi:arylsulfatase A-like enzyme